MPRQPCNRKAFRCAIAPEYSQAKLRVGSKTHPIKVLDASRDGYTLKVPANLAVNLTPRSRPQLYFRDERWELLCESQYRESEETVHLGVRRLRELTKIKVPRSWQFSILPRITLTRQDPSFLLYLMCAFLIACICLPGVGDSLGTAPKVRDAVRNVWKSLDDTIF